MLKTVLPCYTLTPKESVYEKVSNQGHLIMKKIIQNVDLKLEPTRKRVYSVTGDVRQMIITPPDTEITLLLTMKWVRPEMEKLILVLLNTDNIS